MSNEWSTIQDIPEEMSLFLTVTALSQTDPKFVLHVTFILFLDG